MHNNRRLRLAVIGAVFLLLLVQVFATGQLLDRSRNAAIAAAMDTTERIGRAVEASINRNFVQVDAMLAGLPAILAPYIRDGRLDAAASGRVLRELNNQNFTFRDVLLVGASGMPVTTSLPVSRRRPLPIPLGPAFIDTSPTGGGIAIGGPVRNPVTGEWALFFARPVFFPEIGVLTAVAEVPVPVVSGLLAVAGEAEGLRVTLERDDGTLLASFPHDEMRIGRRLSMPATAQAEESNPRSRFTGEPVLISVRPTLYPALVIATTLELDSAMASWQLDRDRALYASLAFAVLVMALAAALLLWLSQREKAEAERAAWRARLENALDSMSDGFVMFGPDDRLIACNEPYKRFYSISAPFIRTGVHFRDILREGALRGQYPQAGPDIEAFINAMDYWRHSNNPPIERLLPDGRWVLITERSTPDGGTVGIRTDITQLKRAMEDLAAARDAARAAGEAKSQFLARMSHELRTPLNGILGFAQVLLRDPTLSPDQREQVETLNEAGQHLLELVNGLLDLSKIEAGKFDLHLRDVSLRPLLDGCAGLLAPEVARKSQRFSIDVAPGTPAAVVTDSTRLRQLLLNLLSNAVKFTPPGGHVQLRALPMPGGAPGIRIEVQDSGPGIPDEKRHLLFEDFSQLFTVPGQEGAGTGLGLAISARLAALMGGRIGCEAAVPHGALFWIELPLAEAELPAIATLAGQAAPAPEPMAPLHVLVADDVAANRMVARAMLVAAGHRVDSAANGAEALAAVERESYDVVLMDVQMPVMDGLEAARRIRQIEGKRGRVPILAVTASALPEQVDACTEAGMDGHLAKPIDREALLAALRRLASGVPVAVPVGVPGVQSDAPLLDPAALAMLVSDLGATAPMVIAEFLAELRLGLEAVSAEGIETDTASLRGTAHRLLGAARTLGARRLVRVVEVLQEALRSGQDPTEPLRHVMEVAAATIPVIDAAMPVRTTRAPKRVLAQGAAD